MCARVHTQGGACGDDSTKNFCWRFRLATLNAKYQQRMGPKMDQRCCFSELDMMFELSLVVFFLLFIIFFLGLTSRTSNLPSPASFRRMKSRSSFRGCTRPMTWSCALPFKTSAKKRTQRQTALREHPSGHKNKQTKRKANDKPRWRR